jgi:hypothetical protein
MNLSFFFSSFLSSSSNFSQFLFILPKESAVTIQNCYKAATILKEHKAPIIECLVKEIAKPAKDSVTEASNSF